MSVGIVSSGGDVSVFFVMSDDEYDVSGGVVSGGAVVLCRAIDGGRW